MIELRKVITRSLLVLAAGVSFATHARSAPLISAGGSMSMVADDENLLWGVGIRPYPGVNEGRVVALSKDRTWAKLYTGRELTLGIDSGGALWSWRTEEFPGPNPASYYPVRVGTQSDWRSISVRSTPYDLRCFAIKQDGTLWSWVHEETTDEAFVPVPVQVGDSTDWSAVTGDSYTLAIRKDGTLWAWGRNSHGSLGDGTNIDRQNPVRIGSDTDWKYVSTVGYTSFGIKTDGSLWVWGLNWGAYGNEDTYIGSAVPVRIGTGNNWLKISGHESTIIAIRSDGSLWSWGDHWGGMLGLGDVGFQYFPARVGAENNWVDVDACDFHVIATRGDGSVWAWGNLSRFGLDGITESKVPIDVSHAFSSKPGFVIYDGSHPIVNRDRDFWSAEIAILNEPKVLELKIRNDGFAPLVLSSGGDLEGFTATFPTSVPGLSDAVVRIQSDATTAGHFSGEFPIHSNDPNRPVFTVDLDGFVVSPANDSDGDGLNDAAEVALAPLGFVWHNKQDSMVSDLFKNAGLAGMHRREDVMDVRWNAEAPVLSQPGSQLQIPLEFRNFPDRSAPRLVPMGLSEKAGGELEMEFQLPADKRLMRLMR